MKRFFVFLIFFSCGQKNSDVLLSVEEFEAKYKATENAILLDVRTPEEVAEGKIPGAKNIVWDDSFAEKLSTLENKPLFIYCGSGIRSAKAAAILREKGYKDVFELDGGIKSWREAGKSIE